jgi:hypothetical protein
MDKRYASGFSYQVAYTWSKAMDETDGYFGVEGTNPQNPYDPAASRGPAGFDLTNVLSANALYEVPIGKGKRFSTGNGLVDYVLGNWQINNIFTARSGQPYTITVSGDNANTGNGGTYERANVVGDPNKIAKRTAAEWINTAAFAIPARYTYGDGSTNSLRSQNFWNFDSSVFRQFPFWGERRFEFRAEAFNLLNHAVFAAPGSDLNTPNTFGKVSSTANSSRELQLGAKIIF